ncbi:MAG: hypothetical protein IPI66_08295 [Chitinophagaceae bacterium]|nr:hypothetical protein [Chitinophagaceae bacterium]MBL0057027.1 hypothetical protein [Chitinophagaceae bacterium]
MTRICLLCLFIAVGILTPEKISATPYGHSSPGPVTTSTQQEALVFINQIATLKPSAFWPNIKPASFLQNLRKNIEEPLSIYQGISTNFCGYGAITYLFLQDDPLGYAKLLLHLYEDGKSSSGTVSFTPSDAIRQEAGLLRYKGTLDIRPAEQMWFLCLADHFKGYLNFFNRRFDPGDENKFWASVNYAKFNRIIRSLLNYQARARGTDLIRPALNDTYGYIKRNLENGPVILYINNRIVHKKKHNRIKFDVPTHFIAVQRIDMTDEMITLVYWDYGGRTQIQLTHNFLKKIVFGITCCTPKTGHAD